jgi:signal transduction histidine kinase
MSADPDVAAARVVLVDDTDDLRHLLRIALRRAGYDVVGEAGDGRAGIEVTRDLRPDLVLLDLSMPVMDGLEALPVIRGHCPDATIVVLSGFGATQMAERALARGADGYIQKGASLASIIETVGDLLGRRVPPRPRRQPASVSPLPSEPEAPASAWEVLDLAPVGVLELTDDETLRVARANPVAHRILDRTPDAGTPLVDLSPELAELVSTHRVAPDTALEAVLPVDRVQATLRRAGGSLWLYLDPAAEEASVLRRAIAMTAHEIRGPVTVICGTAETIDGAGEDDLGHDQLQQMAGSMVRQARILDRITTDLLTAAQAQRGTLRVAMGHAAPGNVAAVVVAGRYDATVTVTDQRPVRADPLRLEQLLTNLLTNAQKYGRPPVEVHVRPDGDRVAIEVVDHGDGVPEEFRGQLFQAFARADSTVATGTGLGLYVVRTLAEAQGGGVSYAPRVGGGSVFTISLPVD